MENAISGIVKKVAVASNGSTWLTMEDGNSIVINEIVEIKPQQAINITKYAIRTNSKTGGEFFVAQQWDTNYASQKLAIIKYLSGPLFKGMGEHYATTMIDYCGNETDFLDIIRNNYQKLFDIKGIPASTISKFIQQWELHKASHESMIWLLQFGLGYNVAKRTNEFFSPKTIDTLTNNPYQLTRIDGVGFHKADNIALQLGIPRDSNFRVDAAIQYALKEALLGGNCYLPYTLLAEKTLKLIESQVGIFHIGDRIKYLIEQSILIEVADCVYLKYIYEIEKEVAAKLADLISTPYFVNPKELERQILRFKINEDTGISLTQKQTMAIESALKNKVSIITGGPGVGKSLITKYICDLLEYFGIRYSLAAPTGRAAKRLMECTERSAKTIHRLLRVQKDGTFFHNEERPLDTDCVLIDETSMLDISLCKRLLDALPDTAKLILIGDYNQLPSVGPGNVLRDMIKSERIPCTTLTTIFRQDEKSAIVETAHEILKGNVPNLPTPKASHGKNCVMIRVEDMATLKDYLVLLIKENLPKIGIAPETVQVITPLRERGLGIKDLNPIIQEALNPPADGKRQMFYGNITYRVGDKVMQIRNDYNKGVFNGDIGYIVDVFKEGDQYIMHVEYPDCDDVVEYTKAELDDLLHAFASTVHRSQGSEYEVVILIAHPSQQIMLQRNLVYTGLTRAKKLCIIMGTDAALQYAIENDREIKRYTRLKEWLKEDIKAS